MDVWIVGVVRILVVVTRKTRRNIESKRNIVFLQLFYNKFTYPLPPFNELIF